MADNQLSSFPIARLLEAIGARPGKSKNTYHSPFREDKDASLHIDPDRNVWFDHGAGVGGGNVDLVMKCRGCTGREAAEFILSITSYGSSTSNNTSCSCGNPDTCRSSGSSNTYSSGGSLGNNDSSDSKGSSPHRDSKGTSGSDRRKGGGPLSSRILMITDLRSPYLLEYAASRGIPEAVISRYCKNVILRGRTYGRTYDHIGFPNNAGGFALKAPSGFKCTTKGFYTTIDMAGSFTETPMSDTVTVFEGFFDFLSWLARDNRELPTTDVCVLNSVTNTTRAVPYLRQHKTLICCLDNDEAGRAALETLKTLRKEMHYPVIIDGSLFYYGYKDVNEWWVANK